MFKRLLAFLFVIPVAFGVAGTRPSNDPPPVFASEQQELEWIEEELERKRKERRGSESRAKYLESEGDRLTFIDYGNARHFYGRAARAQEKADAAQLRIEELERRREELRGNP